MKARRGQVAVYMALVLVIVTLLLLMNVSVFLGVSAKNDVMNAGDAAALAVADHQRDLLNRIGRLNVEHLNAAIKGDSKACERCVSEQLMLSFLGPLEGLAKGDAAAKNEVSDLVPKTDQVKFLKDLAATIRAVYAVSDELYPEPWEGAWEDYAAALEAAIYGGLVAGPEIIDFVDPVGGHVLYDREFYFAVEGRNWCWFKLYNPGLIDNYATFRDWAPLPTNDLETRRRKCVNSMIYSLGLEVRVGSALELLGYELISHLTGKSEAELKDSILLEDRSQVWFFYDRDVWRAWDEMKPVNGSPLIGSVRPEYDVAGCLACCGVAENFVNLTEEGLKGTAVWQCAAKPFGTVTDLNGELSVVTSLGGFVTEAFSESKLVPILKELSKRMGATDAAWMYHVSEHLADYCANGPNRAKNCYYCRQLVTWEHPSFRSEGRRWIKLHGNDCYRPSGGPGGMTGGSPYGH